MFKTILVPIDMQEPTLADRAVDIAVQYARESSGRLYVLTVLPGFGSPLVASFFPPDSMKKARTEADKRLRDYVAAHVPQGVEVTVSVSEGSPYERIMEEADAIGADLIVLPSHTRKLMDRVLLGSCASRVVEHARCSVLVIRGHAAD